MSTNRRLAVAAGVAFLIATIAQLVGVALASPILNAPDYLAQVAANQDRVVLGALALPLAVQEMVLAVWLIAKGYVPSTIAAEPASELPQRRPTPSPLAAS